MEEDAIYEMRSLGVMLLEPQSFGDKRLGELIKALLSALTDISASMGDPARLQKLIDQMLNSEYGRLLNMPGPLFQIMFAYLLKLDGVFIEPGKQVASPDGIAEIDLFVQNNAKEICAIECKGYKRGKTADRDEVEDWINKKRVRIAKWYQQKSRDLDYKGLSFKFVISSVFTDKEKAEYSALASASYKQFPVEFLDVRDVEALARKHAQHEILRGLKDYFGA